MAHTPRDILMKKLEDARAEIGIGSKWKHTKTGGTYIVTDVVIREDNEEIRVIYKELEHEPPFTWDRSYNGVDGWIVPTEIDGKEAPRFTKI